MPRKITIREIAAEAGVSKTAASFYLNGKAKQHNFSDATCERIRKVIEKYDFTPNLHAKAINSGKTLLIGVIVADINHSFWNDIIAGIEEAIETYKYHMLLTVSRHDTTRAKELLEFLDQKGVDGYIYTPVSADNDAPNIALLQKIASSKPVVSIITPLANFPSVYNDNYHGGRVAAEHLFSNGHLRVACVGIPLKGDLRDVGFAEYYKERNIEIAVYHDVDSFIPHAREYTACFCRSDYLLMDVYHKAALAGIRIPEDISTIGYDNMEFVTHISPPLTTIHQYKAELGKAAGGLLMKLLHHEEVESRHIKFFPRLINGASVKKLPPEKK